MNPQEFRRELQHLINRCSMENGSDTPDFILADYLQGCLNSFDAAVKARRAWYGDKKEKTLGMGVGTLEPTPER